VLALEYAGHVFCLQADDAKIAMQENIKMIFFIFGCLNSIYETKIL
jgi:uncharacterized membrane protein YhfC